MSTETPPVASRRTHASKKPKRSFWKRDLGSLGKDDEEPIEHPPFVPTLPFVDVLPDKVREAILLRKVRRWLAHWDEVLAYAEAPQHAGGGGAVVVLLKGS